MAEAVRPKRSRAASSRVRTFDVATRNEIKRKRLESLEADNWHEDRRQADEDDDDYNPLDDASSGDGARAPLPRIVRDSPRPRPLTAWMRLSPCRGLG